ncbi:hypothetical protein HK096_007918, partial [Nowakowskiella sp. JEL0078]
MACVLCDDCVWGPLPAPVCLPSSSQEQLLTPAWAFFGWASNDDLFGAAQRKVLNSSISPSPWSRIVNSIPTSSSLSPSPSPTVTLNSTALLTTVTSPQVSPTPIQALISVPLYGRQNNEVLTSLSSITKNCQTLFTGYYSLFSANATLANACTYNIQSFSSGFPSPFTSYRVITGCFFSPSSSSWQCFNPFISNSTPPIPCPISDINSQFSGSVPQCSPPATPTGSSITPTTSPDTGLIGGVTAVVLVILAAIILFFLWRARKVRKQNSSDISLNNIPSSTTAHSTYSSQVQQRPPLDKQLPTPPNLTRRPLRHSDDIPTPLSTQSSPKSVFSLLSPPKKIRIRSSHESHPHLRGEPEQSVLDAWGTLADTLHSLATRLTSDIAVQAGSIFLAILGIQATPPSTRADVIALQHVVCDVLHHGLEGFAIQERLAVVAKGLVERGEVKGDIDVAGVVVVDEDAVWRALGKRRSGRGDDGEGDRMVAGICAELRRVAGFVGREAVVTPVVVEAVRGLVEAAVGVFIRLKAIDSAYCSVLVERGGIFEGTVMDGGVNMGRGVTG